ncbi:hypothetical protein DIPPA_06172 [Diplonema papillatum]|nr:hypothetical protein DIPPA_06172 [Diplonema papillatum]
MTGHAADRNRDLPPFFPFRVSPSCFEEFDDGDLVRAVEIAGWNMVQMDTLVVKEVKTDVRVKCRVSGSADVVYNVTIFLEWVGTTGNYRTRTIGCSCPQGRAGTTCKHAGALLLILTSDWSGKKPVTRWQPMKPMQPAADAERRPDERKEAAPESLVSLEVSTDSPAETEDSVSRTLAALAGGNAQPQGSEARESADSELNFIRSVFFPKTRPAAARPPQQPPPAPFTAKRKAPSPPPPRPTTTALRQLLHGPRSGRAPREAKKPGSGKKRKVEQPPVAAPADPEAGAEPEAKGAAEGRLGAPLSAQASAISDADGDKDLSLFLPAQRPGTAPAASPTEEGLRPAFEPKRRVSSAAVALARQPPVPAPPHERLEKRTICFSTLLASTL